MRKESRQVIGAIDCFDYDTTNRKAAIGLLIDPGHKRQGFGRDALETFVEYAFRFLHLHQCPSSCVNRPSDLTHLSKLTKLTWHHQPKHS